MDNLIDIVFSKTNYDVNTLKPTQFNLIIDIIDKCNYNCYYCYNHRPRSNNIIDLNRTYQFVYFLANYYPNLTISVAIIGGEPTLHPKLTEFILNCHTIKNVKCVLFSNFSAELSKYNLYLSMDVRLNLSLHLSKNEYDDQAFIDKLHQLPQNQFSANNVNIIMLYDSYYWKRSINLFKRLFASYPNNVSMPFLMDNENFIVQYSNEMYAAYDKLIYSNAEYNKMRQNYQLIVSKSGIKKPILHEMYSDKRHIKYRKFYRYLCDAGKYSLYIHNNGYIYACEAYYDMNISKCSIYNFSSIKFQQTLCQCDMCGCVENAKKKKIFNWH